MSYDEPYARNYDEHRKLTFNKAVIVKDGCLEFSHQKHHYKLTGDFLKALEGRTVLVDAGLMVTRGGVKLGHATRC